MPFIRCLSVAAALAACCGAACAQSSLTLFGVVDLAARVVSNDETQLQLASGGYQTSRLGLRGSERLWDGLSAGFWLEGELVPDTGNELTVGGSGGPSGGFNFRRRSTLSLISTSLGELRVGRDKVPTIYEWEDYDPFGDAGVGRSTRLAQASGIVPADGAYATFTRANNAVGYILPAGIGGLFGQAMVAAGEGQPGNRYLGVRIGWRGEVLTASASYGRTQVNSDSDGTVGNVGALADLGLVKLMGFVSRFEMPGASQDNALVGATLPLGDAVELRASVQAMDGSGRLSGQRASMAAAGAVYSLSRRTLLYATLSRIDNDGTSFTVASGSPLTTGHDSRGGELGLRHAF